MIRRPKEGLGIWAVILRIECEEKRQPLCQGANTASGAMGGIIQPGMI
jgi:hypothetical protein